MLVDLCTKREKYCDDLTKLIAQVKELRREDDDVTMCLSFQLMLLIRKTTFELIAAIRGWQSGFTKLRRPQLMEKDYMIDMVTAIDVRAHVLVHLLIHPLRSSSLIRLTPYPTPMTRLYYPQFVNTIPMRKKFNFMIGRGNIFLLPIQASGRDLEPVTCSPKLEKLIAQFASPSEALLQTGFQALLNSLPPEHMNKVVSAERWFGATWKPDIVVKEIEKEDPLVKRLAEEAAQNLIDEEARKKAEIENSDLAPSAEELEKERKEKEEKDKAGKKRGAGKSKVTVDVEAGAKGDGKEGEEKKAPRRRERPLTLEEKIQKRKDDEVTALVASMMGRPKSRAKPKVVTVTEKASKMSFNTGAMRGMVEAADQRSKKEAEDAAIAATRARRGL
jgi:hypothetical protein